MTTDTQLPKLGTLSPEQRRILCAETLGWLLYSEVRGEYTLQYAIKPGDRMPWERVQLSYREEFKARIKMLGWEDFKSGSFANSDYIPDPDINANDALKLCDKLAEEGQRWRVVCSFNAGMPTRWRVTIYDMDSEDHNGFDSEHPTLSYALTSTFLLATGKAEL